MTRFIRNAALLSEKKLYSSHHRFISVEQIVLLIFNNVVVLESRPR